MDSATSTASATTSTDSAAKPAPVPLLLITGFLGSGKTTFINRLLATAGQPKLGVVVNEFGQVGIDGSLLVGSGILELANGCVCCAKGTEMWEAALDLVDKAGAQVLLVETSGLVEPAALFEQYALLPPKLAQRIDLRGLLCLVDVPYVSEALSRRSEARQQLTLADRLLLTKLDLATPQQLQAAHQTLDLLPATAERASLAPSAGDADVANVLRWAMQKRKRKKGTAATVDLASEHSCEHSHPPGQTCKPAPHRHEGRQLCAISIHEAEPLCRAPLERMLHDLPGEVLRVKGFVRLISDQPATSATKDEAKTDLAVLQLAGHRVELVGPSPELAQQIITQTPTGSLLVFIGEELDESWLRLRLSACRTTPPHQR